MDSVSAWGRNDLRCLQTTESKRSLPVAIASLIGHFFGTAIIFLVVLFLGWLVSLVLHWIHAVLPLPNQTFHAVEAIEVWLLRFDVVLCALLLSAGLWRYLRDMAAFDAN